MLQLKMGRLAHTIGIASALSLALTALIAYGLINWDFLRNAPEIVTILKWIIPLVAGVVVAGVALAVKWEPYLADREEPHFVMSVVALVAPSLVIALIVLDEYGQVRLGRPDWLYPSSLLGVCLTEVSLAMTWEGTSPRRTASIVAAIFPLVLLAFPMLFQFTQEELASILPMAYLGSALAIHLSGAMLHIIASSTSVQQREVLRASDSKLREQFLELEKKREALAYREEALRARESDLEAYEQKLADELASLEERKQQIAAAEAEAAQRLERMTRERQELVKQRNALESEKDMLQLKLAELEAQKRELEKRSKALAAKEETLLAKERDSAKLSLELEARERELRNRLSEVQSEETQLEAMRKELEAMRAALAEKEKQLGMRESALDMKELELTAAREQLGQVAAEKDSIKALEQQLLMRQEALSEKESSLRALEEELRLKSEKAERLIARADKQMNELIEKENAVLAREKALADQEAKLRAELSSIASKLQEMESAQDLATDREKQYQTLAETTRSKLSELEAREEDMIRKMLALEKREAKIRDLEARLQAEHEAVNAKLRQLLDKEKMLEAREAELGLRHAELKAMEREILESVEGVEEARTELPSEEEFGREKALEYRERRLLEREREMKARLYQREKELERREQELRTRISRDLEEVEEAVEEERAVEKIKTGIERLDDLLMGGIPFGSNVLCVGPPFIGKEVAMLLFVAEGLKKGIPAVIVTTSKGRAEIAKDMAPILPTFKELEQVGLVWWIDASGFHAAGEEAADEPNVTIVERPADLQAILAAVDRCISAIKKQKHPYFRFAYFSLSMSIAQADERSALQFVQGLAGKLKQAGAVSLFAVERGMHTEQQLEAIEHHMTGAIQFKTEKQKTFLCVQGICDAQTRDWIEYRHTNKALMLGAFSLERIR